MRCALDPYDFPLGLMFHRFHPSGDASGWQGALSPQDFERILLHVGIDNILSPDEWMSRVNTSTLSSGDLCITFDDGLRCQAEHAEPVLEAYGLRAFWFIYSCVFDDILVKSEIYSYLAAQLGGMATVAEQLLDSCSPSMKDRLESPAFTAYERQIREFAPFYTSSDVRFRFLRNDPLHRESFEATMDTIFGRHDLDIEAASHKIWLRPEDVRALAAKGHSVGLHSYSHPYEMAKLSRNVQLDEYERNQAQLAAITGIRPQCMSHPLNSYNSDSLEVLVDLGIYCGFRSNVIPPLSKCINATMLELAREDSTNLLRVANGEP